MTATIDRTLLRRLIANWKPLMTVEVEVRVLSALLDEYDRLLAEVERLELLAAERFAEGETKAT